VLVVILDTSGTVRLGARGQRSVRGARRLDGEYGYGSQLASHAGALGQHISDSAGGWGQHLSDHAGAFRDHVTNNAPAWGDRAGAFKDHVTNNAPAWGDRAGELGNHAAAWGGNAAGQYNGYKHDASNFWLPSPYHYCILLAQAIFAVYYYCTVVVNYPYWMGPSPQSCELQAEPAPFATVRNSPSNCCLSWCCPQARAAHTFDRTGTLEYWCGLIAMFMCPFCTLCYTNACTDLNPKLGGQEVNPVSSALCTWLCSCCVIAQDAESLDAATGVSTTPCGVSGNAMPYGMGGMGPMGGMAPMGPMGPMGPGMGPGMGPMMGPGMGPMMGPGMGPGMYPSQGPGMYPPQMMMQQQGPGMMQRW